jgi:hypothetical protein
MTRDIDGSAGHLRLLRVSIESPGSNPTRRGYNFSTRSRPIRKWKPNRLISYFGNIEKWPLRLGLAVDRLLGLPAIMAYLIHGRFGRPPAIEETQIRCLFSASFASPRWGQSMYSAPRCLFDTRDLTRLLIEFMHRSIRGALTAPKKMLFNKLFVWPKLYKNVISIVF